MFPCSVVGVIRFRPAAVVTVFDPKSDYGQGKMGQLCGPLRAFIAPAHAGYPSLPQPGTGF